ncbi:Exodeoxyribonuclease VII small subunit [hydrothermal vent metagenome]|uniref:Exodeoxyribonuclease VII small subunit n=1 Tax=hydrothermal vent metagenome TaxID=652676 RepID=A0A3B0ZH76_9ZZZZ
MATKKKSKKSTTITDFNFETALQELEQLVEKMEQGESSLEQSLVDFERGVVLTRQCQESLKSAEQKVQILLEQNGQQVLSDFDNE